MAKQGKVWQLADFICTFITYWLLAVPLHEASHYWIGKLLGYSMTAHFPSPFGGYVEWEPVPANPVHIIAISLAGGCFVALFYLAISLFTKDWETDIVVGYFVYGSLIYALK